MTTPRATDRERGSAMVEAPIAIIFIAFYAMAVIAFVQVLMTYQHLTSSVRATARYAARSDYDPTRAPGSPSRRPTTVEVENFFVESAGYPVDCHVNGATCPDMNLLVDGAGVDNGTALAGQQVEVRTRSHVTGGAYGLVSGLANGMSNLLGLGDVVPAVFTIHSDAVATYE